MTEGSRRAHTLFSSETGQEEDGWFCMLGQRSWDRGAGGLGLVLGGGGVNGVPGSDRTVSFLRVDIGSACSY